MKEPLSEESRKKLTANSHYYFVHDPRMYNAIKDALDAIDNLKEENAQLKQRLSPKPEPEPPRPKKACPWCGREPCVEKDTGDHRVTCTNPDCKVIAATLFFASLEEAIDAWDTRAGEKD